MPVRLVPDELLPPPLDGYRLVARLGRGGFGEVWKVLAPGGIEKAAKFVFGDLDAVDEAEARPAEQEQKAIHRVKAIRHPYILTLERFEVVEGQLIIVMELADRNLWDRFRQCRGQALPGVPRDELLGYLGEAAEALDLMNGPQYGIQHLDIKPQNLFLVHNHVKVADFGLAKDMEAGRERVTITGGVTPVYAAPETFEGRVSRYTDQYSLAIVFQELLTGVRPFAGANTKQLMMQHINGQPDLDSLSPADRRVIGRGLSKRPEDRWPSCTELIKALRSAPGGASGPIRTPVPRSKTDTPPPAESPVELTAQLSRPIGLMTAGQRAGGSGGIPLVTPRLVTPLAANGSTLVPQMTLARPVVPQTGRMTTLGIAPPEKTGDGLLLPALVVAVGQTGLRVVDRLRQAMADRFGSADALPTVRFLYLDTDPEALTAAANAAQPLPARSVVTAKLNRPAHYMQQGAGVEGWLPSGLLYKLPKNPGAAGGVRAFGRLALLDNSRAIGQRVRQEIEGFLTDDPLEETGRATGLGFRTNRPRVYVVAGLAGGTGSGMALDLGYLLKHELRGYGYRKPEVVGVLLAPAPDPAAPRTPALANTFAALHELRHFAGAGVYSQRFDPDAPPVTDPDGPFARTTLYGLPKAVRSKTQRAAWGLAARGLFTELFTTAGKAIEGVRGLAPATTPGPTVTLTGLHRLSWPRPELLVAATRRFARAVLDRWASKESLHLRPPILAYLADEWSARRLDPAAVQAHLAQVARDHLREEPGVVFDAALSPLRDLTPGGSRVDAETAATVFDPLQQLVGRPPVENDPDTPLTAAVRAAAGDLVKQADAFLSELTVRFIELPQYRLAGADEAITQLAARVQDTIEEFEAARATLAREVSDGYGKALAAIGGQRGPLGGRRAGPELADALGAYAHKRLRLTLTDGALSLYRSLANSLPELQRDVKFCRERLVALADTFAPPAADFDPGPATLVLPAGCDTPEAAAEQLIGALLPEDLQEFDVAIQAAVHKQFRRLATVLTKADKEPPFLALLTDHARRFLDSRIGQADPATMLVSLRGDGEGTAQLLRDAFAKAAPDLTGWQASPAQAALLAAPSGPAGDRVRQLAADACPDLAFDSVLLPDDILVVRECPRAPLDRLPHLGPHAREAFLAQLGTDHPPHARKDVPPPD